MLIVRYWSIRRLDRLYDLARKEALDVEKTEADRMTDSSSLFATSAPAVQHPGASLSDTALFKLPVISLGVDTSLSAMEDSPKDMLRLTEAVVESLLSRWVHIAGHRRLGAPDTFNGQGANLPRVYVSSENDDDSGNEFEGHRIRGYYLEGTTTDWRRPHSQEARHQAARLRKQYSGIQARVESDSEGSEDSMSQNERPKNPRRPSVTSSASDHAPEQGQTPSPSRRHNDSRSIPQATHTPFQPQSSQARPIPMTKPQQYNSGWSADRTSTSPRSPKAPTGFSSGSVPMAGRAASTYAYHMPNGLTPPGYSNPQMQTPRYYPPPSRGISRSMSDHSQPHLSSPSRRRSRSGKGSSSSPHRESDRHKDLKRTATRGILGASAIAGFMDALDAFSII